MSEMHHSRDRVRETCCYLPGIKRGRFEVYPRTDGKFFVYDPTRAPADRMVPGTLSDTLAEATAHCDRHALVHPGDYAP